MLIDEHIIRHACADCSSLRNSSCPYHVDEKDRCRVVADAAATASRRVLYFDTETTGLPHQPADPALYGETHNAGGFPKLVQLAWILTDGLGRTLSEQSHIIRPDGFTIPEDASAIHGISTERALVEGIPVADVLGDFTGDLLQADTIVGHNIGFDVEVAKEELERIGASEAAEKLTSTPVVDTMKETVELCAIPYPEGEPRKYDTGCDYKYPKLRELYKVLFGKEFENAHDALADIRATRECYEELINKNVIQYGE